MKRRTEPKPEQPRKFCDGETVLILRSHLWSGAVGSVIGFAEGKHKVLVRGKDHGDCCSLFRTDVEAEFLEGFI